MEKYNTSEIPKSSRITRLVDHLYAKMPEIESYRAKLITESYKETEDQPIITRRAKAFFPFYIIFRSSSVMRN